MIRFKVGYLVGSLASDSINRKLAAALVRLAPSSMKFSEISIRDLPLYSRDYDDDFPASVTSGRGSELRGPQAECAASALKSLVRP